MAEPPDLLPLRNSAATSSPLTLNSAILSHLDVNSFPPLPSSARIFRSDENLNQTTPNSNSSSNPENPQIGTWASKLGSKGVGKRKLSFIPPTMVNGEPVIHLQSTQFGKIQQKNERLVIGSFVTKRESFEFVQSIVKKAWKPKGKVTMKFYGRKSFSFAFEDEEDKAQALEFGNFHIASQLFLVRPLKLFVEADLKNLETIPIWVLFRKIPEELWDDEGFSRIASAIGEPLFADRKTELKTKTDYARICVEVKATSNFPTVVPVVVDKKRVFRVSAEYNWKPPRCIHCKVFGHNEENCSRVHKGQKQSVWVQKKASSIENVEVNESVEVMEIIDDEVTTTTDIAQEGREKAQEQHEQQLKEVLEEDTLEKEISGETTIDTDMAGLPPQLGKQTNEEVANGSNSAEEGEITEANEKQQMCVAGFKLLSSSDAVPASLNGIIEEVDLVNKRMGEFLKGNAKSAPLSSPSRTPLGKKRLTAVSLASRKSQRDISAPERLDL